MVVILVEVALAAPAGLEQRSRWRQADCGASAFTRLSGPETLSEETAVYLIVLIGPIVAMSIFFGEASFLLLSTPFLVILASPGRWSPPWPSSSRSSSIVGRGELVPSGRAALIGFRRRKQGGPLRVSRRRRSHE